MACGIIAHIAHIDVDGQGTIYPDSRGEPIHFTTDSDASLLAGDRVSLSAAVTQHGVIADRMRLEDGNGRFLSQPVSIRTADV